MQEHHKKPTRRLIGSVDGMIAGPGPHSAVKPASYHLGHKPKVSQDQFVRRSNLDDFKRADGFHPAKQPKLEAAVSAAAPAVVAPLSRPLERQPRRRPDGSIDLSLPEGAAKPKKSRFRLRRPTKRGVMISGIVVLLGLGAFFGNGWYRLNQVFGGGSSSSILQDGVDPGRLNGEGDGRVNILLLGKGGDGHTAPDLTDTILVASIDPINKKAALLSIPRDLYVQPDGGGSMKINAVYATAKNKVLNGRKIANQEAEAEKAGLDAIQKEVAADMGIPIHYYVMVDFEGFRKAIDTVGGIDINVGPNNTVKETLWDEHTGKQYKLDVKTGQQHFDGQRALFYSRSRATSARGDFDRAERQRLVLQALKDKVLSAGTLSNPAKVSGLLNAFGQHVSSNLSLKEVMRLQDIAKGIPNDAIASLGLADPPNNFVQTDNINGLSIVRPRAGVGEYAAIQNFVRNSLKDGFIANENAKILILNGTSIEGLATKKSDELKSYGYNVAGIGTAPTQTYTKTQLIDLRNGSKKYTKRYLEQRLKLTATTTLPDAKIVPGDADFVIILGSNEQ
jgi:polyisoprenyl-teichoic acid--peptidoglycan teichoic acid transferase